MSQSASRYFVPQPSHWPIVGSLALLLLASGAVMWMNNVPPGKYTLMAGFAVLVYMLFGWFGAVIANRVSGPYLRLAFGVFVVVLGVSLIVGAFRRLGWL
mgnify:CR=1 FL=1